MEGYCGIPSFYYGISSAIGLIYGTKINVIWIILMPITLSKVQSKLTLFFVGAQEGRLGIQPLHVQ